MPPLYNPHWASVLGNAVARVPRIAMNTAGRVMKDIGSKDPAVARAALRMVGLHAAAGAGIGGIHSMYTGDGFLRGAVRGGIAGGAFGVAGGVGSLGRAYRSGYKRAHYAAERIGLSRFETGLMKSGMDPETLEMVMRTQRGNAARRLRGASVQSSTAFDRVHGALMGGYNPFANSAASRAAGASSWRLGNSFNGLNISGGFGFNLNVNGV